MNTLFYFYKENNLRISSPINTGKLAILLAILLMPFSLFSDEVGKITFKQTGNTYPEAQILFNIQTRKGVEFNRKTLDEDIKRLHATGLFVDVKAETKVMSEGKVEIIFFLQSQSMITSIVIRGNKKFSTKDLLDKIPLKRDVPLNDNQLRESTRILREFYREEGYKSATITPDVKLLDDGKSSVVFIIDEKLRYKVNEIIFDGNI